MLNLLLPLLNFVLVALVVALVSRSALAYEIPTFGNWDPFFYNYRPDHGIELDLLFFKQWDQGGDPLVDEGFRYEALGLDLRFKLSDQAYFRGSAVVAYLQNNPLITLPATITNAHVSSASTDFVTLDAFMATDLTLLNSCWTLSPGLFYHHQWAYIATGLDLDAHCVVAGGNAVLRLAYSGRYASLRQVHWDGSPVDGDQRITHNAIVGWTQFVSPSVITYLGLQYTRQTGLLSSTLQFVGLYNSAGQPVELVDEVLPRLRDRFQLNARARYTPAVGKSIGVDASAYYDDWGILNLAIEPNFETPVFRGPRLRGWVYISDQRGSKYFTATPTYVEPYMTQNSNLGTFVYLSPGALLLVPLDTATAPHWMLRALVLGFYRTDHIYGLGGAIGASVEW
jgi:hypothetical protein